MNIDKDFLGKKTYITVDDIVTAHVTEEEDPNDEWSSESTNEDHYISGFTFQDGKSNTFDLIYPEDLSYGDDLYLVYCSYTEGDSFSTHSGKVDYIGVFKNHEKALECEKVIREHYEKDGNSFSIKVPVDDVNYMSINTPWVGYFESLDDVFIEKLSCKKDNDLNRVERINLEKKLAKNLDKNVADSFKI